MPRIISLPLITFAVAHPAFCIAFKSQPTLPLRRSSRVQFSSTNKSDQGNVVISKTPSDPVVELLPQLYTYQKPRQIRQATLTRKPRFYWHDVDNIKIELESFWNELNVSINEFYPAQSPPIPSEFLLNKFSRNDLRWGIAQYGGRDNLSHALGGAVIIPGKWKEAKDLDIMKSILHLLHNDEDNATQRSKRSKKETLRNANKSRESLADIVTAKTKGVQKQPKEFWTKEKAIFDLYCYLDNYKKYKSRPSVFMPQLVELKHEGYSRLFNSCSRFKKLPHGVVLSQLFSDGDVSIEYMAGLVPYKEWRFFESQLQLLLELRHYLNVHHNGSDEIFPDPMEVKTNGHENLSVLIRSHGGKQLLAQKLDMELVSTRSIQSWGPFSLDFAIELLQFIRERYMEMSPPMPYPVLSMPSERDLKMFGRDDLCSKVESFGGFENVARRLGLSFFDACKQHQLDEQMIRGAKKLWKKRSAN